MKSVQLIKFQTFCKSPVDLSLGRNHNPLKVTVPVLATPTTTQTFLESYRERVDLHDPKRPPYVHIFWRLMTHLIFYTGFCLTRMHQGGLSGTIQYPFTDCLILPNPPSNLGKQGAPMRSMQSEKSSPTPSIGKIWRSTTQKRTMKRLSFKMIFRASNLYVSLHPVNMAHHADVSAYTTHSPTFGRRTFRGYKANRGTINS